MNEFCPEIWAEEKTPEHLIHCCECGLCEHGSRMIWGEGNPEASIMIILDNPGAREDRKGEPFVCGTRQTLQQAIKHVQLNQDDVYVTYILKRRPKRAYEKEKTRQKCMIHLEQQLKVKKPSLIICLGNVAVQSFFKDPEAEVKTLRGRWHQVNGYETTVAYHPLAIRRRPNLWSMFIDDLKLVAERYEQLK